MIAPQATTQENPQPQIAQAPNPTESGTNGDKLVIVMVGLPARGKTYIARKIAHYFRFFHGAPAEVYNVGNYRRQISGADQSADFFNSSNSTAMEARQEAAEQAMNALKKFMRDGNEIGRVGIYDATNTTKSRRDWIMSELQGVVHSPSHVVFVEIICNDDSVIDNNIRAVKTSMPDYKGKDAEEAVNDFRQRIDNYKNVYQTIEDQSLSFIKLFDEGRKMTANNIRGSLQSTVGLFVVALL
jgi:predicted kinase